MNVLGIDFDQDRVNAWDKYEEVRSVNPIAKIPVLVTEAGEIITESWAILDWLDQRVGPERALMPPPPLRDRVRRITALAGAVTDKGRELRYERQLRPARLRHADWIARWSEQICSALDALDGWIEAPFAAGDRLTQADITVFVMVDSIRYNHHDLMRPGRYPNLQDVHAQCGALEAFRQAAREPLVAGSEAMEPG